MDDSDDEPREPVAPPEVREHPIFGRIPRGPSGTIEAITDRRVEQARADGLFDNLPGAGKPIPDIDRRRPPGWWAQRFVKTERTKLKAIELEDELRKAMPPLWRLESAAQVIERIAELNAKIEAYNRITDLQPRRLLNVDETLAKWRGLADRRAPGDRDSDST